MCILKEMDSYYDYHNQTDDCDLYNSDTMDNNNAIPVAEAIPVSVSMTTKMTQELLEKRKTQTTELVMGLLDAFHFVHDKNALSKMFKCLSHVLLEFSDIDWNNVASTTDNNKIVTVNSLLIQAGYWDVANVFLENNLLNPCVKDARGFSLEEYTKHLSEKDKFVSVVNAKIVELQRTEISALKTVCASK